MRANCPPKAAAQSPAPEALLRTKLKAVVAPPAAHRTARGRAPPESARPGTLCRPVGAIAGPGAGLRWLLFGHLGPLGGLHAGCGRPIARRHRRPWPRVDQRPVGQLSQPGCDNRRDPARLGATGGHLRNQSFRPAPPPRGRAAPASARSPAPLSTNPALATPAAAGPPGRSPWAAGQQGGGNLALARAAERGLDGQPHPHREHRRCQSRQEDLFRHPSWPGALETFQTELRPSKSATVTAVTDSAFSLLLHSDPCSVLLS